MAAGDVTCDPDQKTLTPDPKRLDKEKWLAIFVMWTATNYSLNTVRIPKRTVSARGPQPAEAVFLCANKTQTEAVRGLGLANNLYYYEWEFNRWLGSATRADMSLNDRAIYRDLLDHQAANGSLPDDNQALANRAMCSIGQMDAFMQGWGAKLFPIGEDGARRNAVLQAKRDAILARRNKRRSAGVKGAKARWDGNANGNANGKRDGNAIVFANANALAIASDSDSDSSSDSGSASPLGGSAEGGAPIGTSFWLTVCAALPAAIRTDRLRDAWLEWEQHRREIRKRLTPKSVTKQAKDLAEMNNEQRAIDAIETSIRSGWTGIFEGKRSPGGASQSAGDQARQRRAEEARRQGAEDIIPRLL